MKLSAKQRINLNMIFCILLALAFLSCDLEQFHSEITVYPAMCKGVLKNGHCNGLLIGLNRTTYKVSFKRQEIVYWMPGIYEQPRRLVNCVVRDRKNWVGEYQDGSGKEIMIKGKLSEEPPSKYYFYVTKWRWWYAHFCEGKDLPRCFFD
jgi:hypothetical protein